MRFIAFPCLHMLQRFALKLHVGYHVYSCLFMNWDLLFDFLFKFENLSNILNQDRKDITAHI